MATEILQEILGDEKARVSVSKNIKALNFGTGCGTQVTVPLTCSQEDDSIHAAHALADALSNEFTTESFKAAKQLLKENGLLKKMK